MTYPVNAALVALVLCVCCSFIGWSMWGTGILTVIMGLTWQGFVAQKFLESHAARGLILLNPFPPSPGMGLVHLFATAIQR